MVEWKMSQSIIFISDTKMYKLDVEHAWGMSVMPQPIFWLVEDFFGVKLQ